MKQELHIAMRSLRAVGILLMLAAYPVTASMSPPLDVTATRPIVTAEGEKVAGRNPAAARLGLEVIPGGLIQVIDAGPNQLADLPNPDGSPGGDDRVFAVTTIGVGISPDERNSGCFSKSFHPPPPEGTLVYVRVFDGPTPEVSTHWGQSGLHRVHHCDVFDVSVSGLWIASMPLRTELTTTDSDGDGMTDAEELIANTNAEDASDVAHVGVGSVPATITLERKPHRRYLIEQRATMQNSGEDWLVAQEIEPTSESGQLTLDMIDPEGGVTAFYRIRICP